ncbi:carbohydrate ABC transporter permease [Ruegeria hyattellae]|uniref:carbohydrate ABC transporter permease n=1 Tax=Ruegeria hyattellae TaxID=3233337 RepID=UPI00355C2B87
MIERKQLNILLLHVLLTFFALATLFPILIIGLMAFKTNNEIFAAPLRPPDVWRFSQIADAWVQGNFKTYYLNSIMVSVPTVLIVVSCSTLAAYGLVFARLKGSRIMLGLFLLGLIMPLQAVVIPLFHLQVALGLLNTHFGLVLAQAAVGMPFGVFLMRSFMSGLPREIIEAARIDGATDVEILRRVVLPISTAPAMTLATLQFMYSWNDFLLPLMLLQDPEMRTVTLGLFYLQGGTYTLNYTMISAGVLITSAPIMVVFFALQRQFIAGATIGAVK